MVSEISREHFEAGKRFLARENLDKALRAFEKAYKEDKTNAAYMSYYGLCTALRAGQVGLGLELCTRAIKKEFFRGEFYLNLGLIYLSAGNKKGAIKVLKKGIRFDPKNARISSHLAELGCRNRPVLNSLERSNPVNKMLGLFFRKTMPGLLKKR
jgi:tetratricopeptide (TPR) repeat protein